MSTKSSKSLITLGSVVAGLLIYGSYRKTRKNLKIKKIKEWVDWDIEFKENTNALDKAKTINIIEKFIIDYLYRQEPAGVIIKSIKFSYQDLDKSHFHIKANIRLNLLDLKVPYFPHPPGPPPIPLDIIKSLRSVETITDRVMNKKFNNEHLNRDPQ